MASLLLPLRWESTGDQWWYASPIDWAAANGHYDLVRELLHLDANLLIKLTSLRRVRRLETVWDDDPLFGGAAARGRASVARSLLCECERKDGGGNSLIRAGYGGWLLYAAASAGDLGFARQLLDRDPLLVFGEGEYGVTDILYAAARSRDSGMFRLLFGLASSPQGATAAFSRRREEEDGGGSSAFEWEIMNRAVHASARGGNLEILKELLEGCKDVLCYRDLRGSTVLHAASGRGRVEVVRDLLESFDIISSRDNQGNTALHVAALRGHLTVVEALANAAPRNASLTNDAGDTFLHMAVEGFRAPGFRRLDRQMELVRWLLRGNLVEEIINVRNNDGRTALHVAVVGNARSDLVELLMAASSVDLNIRDADGMTPLDLLSRRPRSESSGTLIKRLVSAGGISGYMDYSERSAIASRLKMQGIGSSSPGTSFRISDSEIFLYSGVEVAGASEGGGRGSGRPSSCSSSGKPDVERFEEGAGENEAFSDKKKSSSPVRNATRRLKILLRWPLRKERQLGTPKKPPSDDDEPSPPPPPSGSFEKWTEREDTPTPLRQRFFIRASSLPNNRRALSVRSSMPSPTSKKKFSAGLRHGVIEAMPHLAQPEKLKSGGDDTSAFSNRPIQGTIGNPRHKSGFANAGLMNQYFCFGAQGLSTGDLSRRVFKRSALPVA